MHVFTILTELAIFDTKSIIIQFFMDLQLSVTSH